MSIMPPSCFTHTGGTPSIGADSVPSLPMWRTRPMRSVTSMLPSGSQAMPHGVSSPSATTSSLNVSSWLSTTMPPIGAGGFAVARVRLALSCSSRMKITSARISCSLNAALNDGIGVGGRPSRMV